MAVNEGEMTGSYTITRSSRDVKGKVIVALKTMCQLTNASELFSGALAVKLIHFFDLFFPINVVEIKVCKTSTLTSVEAILL